jgi:hypothetical protein
MIEEQDAREPGLTEEQLAELRRQRAVSDPNRVPFDEVFKRFRARTV